jgi:hypothetical protein
MTYRQTRTLLGVLLVAVLGVAGLSRVTHDGASGDDLAWAASSCGGATVQPGCLDHFQCYEVKPAFFASLTVTVQDQFGTLTEGLRFPHRLCAPANKNGEGILDPTDHLAGYATKPPPFTKKVNQTVVDQFGTQVLDVVRPDVLMVPTSKDGVALVLPVDHFQCYKVKRSKGAPKFAKRTVSVQDQFETVTTLTLVKPFLLCAPANKNNEDPTAPSHPDHLTCYKTRDGKFPSSIHTIDNQFGTDQVTLIHRRELCVPSLKNPPTTTTSTTPTTSTPTSTTTSTSASTSTSTTTTTTSTTTTTTLYGSPSRAFLEQTPSLLD